MIVLDSARQLESCRRSEIAALEDDSLGQQHAGMNLGPADGILDRRALHLETVTALDARVDAVELEIVLGRERPVDLRPGPAEHSPGTANLPADQLLDRRALRGIRALVDEDGAFAVAF